jgi:hypothetical protein
MGDCVVAFSHQFDRHLAAIAAGHVEFGLAHSSLHRSAGRVVWGVRVNAVPLPPCDSERTVLSADTLQGALRVLPCL